MAFAHQIIAVSFVRLGIIRETTGERRKAMSSASFSCALGLRALVKIKVENLFKMVMNGQKRVG